MGDVVGGIGSAVGGLLGAVGLGQPKDPDVVEGPSPAAEQKEVDQAAIKAREDRRRRAVLSSGRRSTVKSAGGSQGLASEKTTKKSILGN